MPLLPVNKSYELGGEAPPQFQPPPAQDDPNAGVGTLDVLASAARQSNLASQVLEEPHWGAAPWNEDFHPNDHIPAGYEQFADKFAWTNNQAEIDWQRARLDSDMRDRRAIAAGGKLGFVSSLAFGATDPVTLASFALPWAGESRLLNVARGAALGAGVSLGQEAIAHQLHPLTTWGESGWNIGVSALLAGALGPFVKDVPRETLQATHDLGPATAGIVDDRVPVPPEPNPEAAYIAQQVRAKVAERGEALRAANASPEAQAVELLGNHAEAESQNQFARQELDRLSRILAEDKQKQISAEVERLQNGPGVLEALRRRYNMSDVSEPLLQRATQTVEANRADLMQRAETARNLLADTQAVLDRRARVVGARVDLEAHENAVRAAGDDISQLADILPPELAQHFKARLAALPPEAPRGIGMPDTGLPAQEAPPAPPLEAAPGESTAGAAAVRGETLGDYTLARGARTSAATLGRVSPGLRLLRSPSLVARKLLTQLANVGEVLGMHMEGRVTDTPIERLLWASEGVWKQGVDARASAFNDYRARMAKEQPNVAAMSRRDFNRSIAQAMRRGDVHEVPEVAKAAKDTRRIVFDPLWERAKALGIAPKETAMFADSYLMRQYDAGKIKANLTEWNTLLRRHFIAEGADPAEAADIAHKVTMNVLGSERGTMDWKAFDDVVPATGRLKGRVLSVPDTVLEPFLNSDIDHLTHSYIRSLAPEVEMVDRFGSRDLAQQISDLKDEYAVLINRKLAAGDNAGAETLRKRQDADVRDISAIRDRLYGIFGQPKDPGSFFVRAGRLLRANNVLRLLGAATLAHFPDGANVVMRYGLAKTIGTVSRLATSLDAMKMARADAHRLGVAIDMAMNTISLLGDFGSHSQFAEQRIANRLSRGFTMLTVETPLVTLVQNVASVLGQDEVLAAAKKVAAGQALDRNHVTRLAQQGIDEPMLQRIAAMDGQFGQSVNGIRFGGSDKWSDREAARVFESAILKDAHGMTLRPSVADTPLLMSSEVGKLVLQFKSFAFAANRAVINPLMQGLARGDPRAIAGLMALTVGGTATYISKQKAAGQPVEINNPGRFALEVLDKSNLMGWSAELIFPGLYQFGLKDLSRWSDRDPIETIGGPSAGTVASVFEHQLPGRVTPGAGLPFRRSDLHFLRRLMPAQNLWFARHAINDFEDYVGDAMNLQGTSNKERASKAGK